MPRPCKKSCCKNLYNPYKRPIGMVFICRIDNCGQPFKFESFLRLHQFKAHDENKLKPIARVKPFNQLAIAPPIEKVKVDKQLGNDKNVELVIKDILAPENYIANDCEKFTCPICAKQMMPGSMNYHFQRYHKQIVKFIEPKIKCSKCYGLIGPNLFYAHKRSCRTKLLAICSG